MSEASPWVPTFRSCLTVVAGLSHHYTFSDPIQEDKEGLRHLLDEATQQCPSLATQADRSTDIQVDKMLGFYFFGIVKEQMMIK